MSDQSALTASLRRWLRLAATAISLAFLAVTSAMPAQPAQWQMHTAEDCEGRIDMAVQAIADDPRLKDMPPAFLREIAEFTTGNMLFVTLHEMGHALISDLGLPVLGREEDAADQFAAVAMIKMGTAFTHRTLVNATKGWLFSDRRDRQNGEPVAYYDEHGLELQRAYNLVCLMIGSDPRVFKDLADETSLPEDRRETCVGDYSNASWSWDQVLKPYRRAPDKRPQTFKVIYGEAKDPYDLVANAIRATGVLEYTAGHLVDRYAVTKPFTLQMTMCGDDNANWDLRSRTLTLCYEMAREFTMLYKAFGREPITVVGQSTVPSAKRSSAKGFR